jgi:hypothetical protein
MVLHEVPEVVKDAIGDIMAEWWVKFGRRAAKARVKTQPENVILFVVFSHDFKSSDISRLIDD